MSLFHGGCPQIEEYDKPDYNCCMSPFYTGRGDDGTTGWLGEGRLPKNHPLIEALGAIDEAGAALGLARALARDPRSGPLLVEVQRDLYKLMAEVAASPENADRFQTIDPGRVTWLEQQMRGLGESAPALDEFILPGDTPASAALALARTVVRRAERRVVALFDQQESTNPEVLRYLNRLSSLCFALELLENQAAGRSTTLAKQA
jgi:cob(I)alamin adenosyltransferase